MKFICSGWYLPLALFVATGLCWGRQPSPSSQQQSQPGQQTPAQTQQQQPSAASDTQIQTQVQRALDANPSLKAAGVTATVTNGQVTLMGVVGNKDLKSQAADTAKTIAGVTGVQDLITVSPSAAMPGAQPAEPGEPQPGEQPAQPPTQPPAQPNQPGQMPPTTQPGQQPAAQPPATQPGRPTQPPAAQQPGETPGQTPATPAQEQQEQSEPRQMSSAQPTSPVGLEGQVTTALMNDPQLKSYALTASVGNDGKVTLRGTVPSKADKKHAEEVVRNINGVEKVRNKIKVNKNVTPMQPNAQQPPSEEPNPYSGQQPPTPTQPNPPPAMEPGQPPATSQPPQGQPPAIGPLAPAWAQQAAANPAAPQDEETQLQNSLKNDPALSGVNVAVSGNKVTLTGTVASKADKKMAERTVKQAAPKGTKIHNDIEVQKTGSSALPSGAPPIA